MTHGFFQAALRVARRVASETPLHRHRVSIPSVAIADFASRIFERFDDKHVLVIGAGKMAQETLHYLADAGARQITVLNRDFAAGRGAGRRSGTARPRRGASWPTSSWRPTWSSARPAPIGPS